MRGNGVISVTGKKEIQTSLTLLRQQRQCSELTLASQSLTGSSEPPGGEGVSSNTLRDRAGEQDKGSGAAGVKRLLAFGLMSSGLVWPKVDWRPPSRENPVIPPPPTGHASIVIHPPQPPAPPPKSARCPSAPRSRNANTKPPIQMIQYYLNPLARVYWGCGGNDGSSGGGERIA